MEKNGGDAGQTRYLDPENGLEARSKRQSREGEAELSTRASTQRRHSSFTRVAVGFALIMACFLYLISSIANSLDMKRPACWRPRSIEDRTRKILSETPLIGEPLLADRLAYADLF